MLMIDNKNENERFFLCRLSRGIMGVVMAVSYDERCHLRSGYVDI
jgi:hypothetical protein